jgi:hypothetical protein
MPETTASRPTTTPALPHPSANGSAPPVPPEAMKARAWMRWPAALGRFGMAMTPLRRIMRRAARRA